MPTFFDVLIAGGGPAGLATAIAAKHNGFERVHVIDAKEPPIDKACGEGLLPKAVEALRSLGVEPESEEHYRIEGVRYIDGSTRLEGRFCGQNREQHGDVFGIGMARQKLHNALHRRAKEVGVSFSWGTRVDGVSDKGFCTSEGTKRGRWLIGADGLHSRIRQLAGMERNEAPDKGSVKRIGWRYHLACPPWTPLVEVYWSHGMEAYVTPLSHQSVGIAVLSHHKRKEKVAPRRSTSLPRAIADHFPNLAKHIGNASLLGKLRGAGPFEQRPRALVRGNVALVGDAAGYFDAITGEGLGHSFLQAQHLAKCLAKEKLDDYQRNANSKAHGPFSMQRTLRFLSAHPKLRSTAFLGLRKTPGAFQRLLVHQTCA